MSTQTDDHEYDFDDYVNEPVPGRWSSRGPGNAGVEQCDCGYTLTWPAQTTDEDLAAMLRLWDRHEAACLENPDSATVAAMEASSPAEASERDHELLTLLRDRSAVRSVRRRDRDQCRFCGRALNFSARAARNAGTFVRIDKGDRGPASVETVVACCQGCESVRRHGTRRVVGMRSDEVEPRLRPAPARSCENCGTDLTGTDAPVLHVLPDGPFVDYCEDCVVAPEERGNLQQPYPLRDRALRDLHDLKAATAAAASPSPSAAAVRTLVRAGFISEDRAVEAFLAVEYPLVASLFASRVGDGATPTVGGERR